MFLGSREIGSRKGGFGRVPSFCHPGDTKDWRDPRKKRPRNECKAGKPDTSFSQQWGNQILKGQSMVSYSLVHLSPDPRALVIQGSGSPSPPTICQSVDSLHPRTSSSQSFLWSCLPLWAQRVPSSSAYLFLPLAHIPRKRSREKKIGGVLWLKNWLGDILCMHLLC